MWIPPVPPEKAEGELAEIYASMPSRDGIVDHVVQAHSGHPAALRSLMSFYRGLMHGAETELALRRREMIAVTVSSLNECHY